MQKSTSLFVFTKDIMSRIGKLPVAIPEGVTATIAGETITIKGPKGELSQDIVG